MVKARAGFTLVEVIVALTLLSVGLLAVAGSAAMASTLLRQSELQEEAAFAAVQVMDSLAVAPEPASGRQARGPFDLEWSVTRAGRSLGIELQVVPRGTAAAPQRFSLTALRP